MNSIGRSTPQHKLPPLSPPSRLDAYLRISYLSWDSWSEELSSFGPCFGDYTASVTGYLSRRIAVLLSRERTVLCWQIEPRT